MFKTYCSIVIFLMLTSASIAQDGHYWTQQYGTRSMLLSGSVVGGVDDLGAVYYNPGRLAVITNAAFLLSASVYELNKLSVSNAFGDSKNASQSEIKGVPTMAAGTFKIKKLPKHFFAYAVMTRQNSNINLAYRNEVHKDVLPTVPGNEYFGAEISINQSSHEEWVGFTWSYPVSKKISVGVTTNLSTSSVNKSGKIEMQALSENNEVGIYRFDRGFTLNKMGLLWKLGVAGTFGKWQTGITATTPTLNFSGSGTYQYEEFFSGMPGLTRPAAYSSSYQTGLKVHNKSPWSLAMGISRNLGKNKIHFSTEMFNSVSKYTAMQAVDHISQSNPGDVISFHLIDQARQVVNAGIGTEIYISDQISGFGSFSTDFTSVPGDISRFVERTNEASMNGWNTDFYHVGGGFVLKFKRADITLGATHTGATQSVPRPVNFPDTSGQSIFNNSDTADIRWDRWRLVFSFSLPFLKDYADRLSGDKKEK